MRSLDVKILDKSYSLQLEGYELPRYEWTDQVGSTYYGCMKNHVVSLDNKEKNKLYELESTIKSIDSLEIGEYKPIDLGGY